MTITELEVAGSLHRGVPQTPTVIAAGPLTKQPSTVATRVVLRVKPDDTGFVVHNEYFPNYPSLDNPNYEAGDYFQPDELHHAIACFGERVRRKANQAASIYPAEVLTSSRCRRNMGNVFTKLRAGRKVLLLTNMYSPTVSEGAVGTITESYPPENEYVVEFSGNRLYKFRADHIRLATDDEIAASEADPDLD